MGGRLDQVLAYLDREGVSEIIICVGRPLALHQNGQFLTITKTPVTRPQLDVLLEGTPLAALVPPADRPPTRGYVHVGGRGLEIESSRRGDEVMLRISAAMPGVSIDAADLELADLPSRRKRPATRASGVTAPPRTKTATRAKGATSAPRTRSVSLPVRSKAVSIPPTDLAGLIERAHSRGASDVHIAAGRPTVMRVVGELVPLSSAPLPDGSVEQMLEPLIAAHRERLATIGYIDLAVDAAYGGRLRANISRTHGGLRATFRLARAQPPTLDELGLPKDLAKVVAHHQGLVVVAGPSGHGKTTTLAALVEIINAARPFHIITVEDPIEIVFPRKAAVVSQREVGVHTASFASALKGSLREDPDVIMIGELRDRETVEIALTAAETGHLVLATMSTPSAAKTIDRLIDMFPPDDQAQVRASIAGALRAIVSQRLLATSDGSARVAAVELLTGCLPLAAMIRDDKVYQLPNLMQRGRAFGMIRLDDSLLELARGGKITHDVALANTDNKRELAAALKTGGPAAGPSAAAIATDPTRPAMSPLAKKGRE